MGAVILYNNPWLEYITKEGWVGCARLQESQGTNQVVSSGVHSTLLAPDRVLPTFIIRILYIWENAAMLTVDNCMVI